MKISISHALFIIITLSLVANSFLIPLNEGLWWDEAVYMKLGQSILLGYYSLDPGYPVETFRPFVFPFLMSPLSHSLLLARYAALLIAAIAIIAVYFAAREVHEKIAKWTAFFTATSYSFVFFSTKVLSESLFIIFLSLSLIFFLRSQKTGRNKYIVLCGAFSSLALMTRYMGLLIISAYFIYLIYDLYKSRKITRISLFVASSFIVALPLFVLGLLYYGDPLGLISTNMFVYGESQITHTFLSGIYQIINTWGLLLLLIAAGIFFMRKKMNIFLVMFVITIAAFLVLPHKEPRYLLSFLPVYATIAAVGMDDVLNQIKSKNLFSILIIILLSINIAIGFQITFADRTASSSLVQASLDVKQMTSSDENILTNAYPYIYYISERRGIDFPMNPSELMNLIDEESIRFIVIE
ncbi:MAG: glycosyltransferase family 39 protein, partial [Nanoarchaeota archaeon]|nr:glycosyltransferase family 39 protein [Nanoarchaeota archaeon]